MCEEDQNEDQQPKEEQSIITTGKLDEQWSEFFDDDSEVLRKSVIDDD